MNNMGHKNVVRVDDDDVVVAVVVVVVIVAAFAPLQRKQENKLKTICQLFGLVQPGFSTGLGSKPIREYGLHIRRRWK